MQYLFVQLGQNWEGGFSGYYLLRAGKLEVSSRPAAPYQHTSHSIKTAESMGKCMEGSFISYLE
jgi:hypothetical protein